MDGNRSAVWTSVPAPPPTSPLEAGPPSPGYPDAESPPVPPASVPSFRSTVPSTPDPPSPPRPVPERSRPPSPPRTVTPGPIETDTPAHADDATSIPAPPRPPGVPSPPRPPLTPGPPTESTTTRCVGASMPFAEAAIRIAGYPAPPGSVTEPGAPSLPTSSRPRRSRVTVPRPSPRSSGPWTVFVSAMRQPSSPSDSTVPKPLRVSSNSVHGSGFTTVNRPYSCVIS